jgi:hypothetical protein
LLDFRLPAVAVSTGHIVSTIGLFIYGKTPPRLGHIAPASEVAALEDLSYHFRIGRPCPF